jgi:hypothetical protein
MEVVEGSLKKGRWIQEVWKEGKGQCSNCGSKDKVHVKMIVPEEAGGKRISSNGYLICRACEMAAASVQFVGIEKEKRRLINFWVSAALYERMLNGVQQRHGFKSMGALVRYLMGMYIKEEGLFEDLEQYQEEGMGVKINVWIDKNLYEAFKSRVTAKGNTVTSTVKSLIRMYEMESEVLLQGFKLPRRERCLEESLVEEVL